ncbi:MAG TPA: glucoamylase family protein [bacterium]|nr:glucoamylase family protein [bacterium]
MPAVGAAPLLNDDAELLKTIQKDTLQYFLKRSDKNTGLTRDSSQSGSPASIAATGFSLAAIAIGQSHGWIPEDWSRDYLKKTLKTLLHRAEQHKGFFYHFLDARSGKRVWMSEVSSIDTALLVAGALVAAQYFPGTEIEKMAWDIYRRVDWPWMMNGRKLICMGWTPETGFLPYYWDMYNEHLILQALALGSPTHPVGQEAWKAWARHEDVYNDKKIVYSYSGSLFTYQFPQAFIDFRGLKDNAIDYFENSRKASLANREYSLSFRSQHKGYSENSWGLSASLGPGGYKAYGGKPGAGLQDGTLAPHAVIASIVFTPEESLAAIRFFYRNYAKNLYGYFGFKSAFNLDKKWWAEEYLGIDQGISVLMLENFLNDGAVWKKFMALEPIKRWIQLCGLTSGKNPGNENNIIPAS